MPLATQLQAAKEKLMNGKAIEAKYRMIDGKLNVESYGMYTPLQYKGNKWYVGGFSDRADPVSNIPIGFEKAEQAVWVANLTNRLIALETGKHSVNRPFSAANYLNNATLRVGDSPSLFEWFKDKRAVDGGRFKSTSTLREYGGDTFQTNIGAYANYLNGLTHANGESIWSTKGQIR
ncbi:hypothetical protein KA478_02915 [Patescibacteria group bacterium]|nr:hypothetical protein [Patescibacteria group bacterium]